MKYIEIGTIMPGFKSETLGEKFQAVNRNGDLENYFRTASNVFRNYGLKTDVYRDRRGPRKVNRLSLVLQPRSYILLVSGNNRVPAKLFPALAEKFLEQRSVMASLKNRISKLKEKAKSINRIHSKMGKERRLKIEVTHWQLILTEISLSELSEDEVAMFGNMLGLTFGPENYFWNYLTENWVEFVEARLSQEAARLKK